LTFHQVVIQVELVPNCIAESRKHQFQTEEIVSAPSNQHNTSEQIALNNVTVL